VSTGSAAHAAEVEHAVELPETGRRNLIKGGMLALAGLAGWKVAEASTSQGSGITGTVADGSLSLTGSRIRLSEDGGALSGELVDSAGRSIGTFASTPMAAAAPGAAAGAELQTFNLPDGMLLGMGIPSRDEPATYAVIGGTGKFGGATGSYLTDQRSEHQGGDGTALWQFNFGS
jgi:hypothetical protein